ncbi:serine/threonine-protein kinase [Kribbella shirazensis]|uniref:non-specific serine/threonine protein kinase n=1 Tax=Kribbella shirazensis TaxID=1105143 RepID=A0A7X5V7A0_9ACTN|nr:serine/threonine-protein kinase [Kribbella shirazensis]NIK55946.1 serine/threonine protein kinase [Kribbella shirazensis]
MGVPTRLGRYVVRRRLGAGGFATVWLAHDEQLDAEVAIKVLADNWGHDDSVRQRFLEEGRFLRRVESEHVVQVHDVGELEDGRPFLVLTYADRGTLADRLKDKPLPLPEAVDVIVQVGRGLQALHRRGLLHRDVKPANVLFRSTDDGERAVLSDLGLGKSLDEISRITMPGGTPSYVAPEQALGERLDQRADQYSLGAVAYAALTGRSPHQVDGLGAAGRVKVAPPPSSLGFDLPEQVDAAIVRALDPDREKRWADVQSFTKQLVGALDETTHSFSASARETVTVGSADLDAKTALSDENQPTSVKPAEPSVPSATGSADAETVAVESAPTEAPTEAPAEPATRPRKKRRGRWAVAALLALLVGGGAGYAGQWYLSGREVVAVAQGGFQVELPRAWAQSMARSVWNVPGSDAGTPAFRVSKDADWSGRTPGVFIGVSKTKLAVPTSTHCATVGTPNTNTGGERIFTDRISTGCFGADIVLLQRVVDYGDEGSLLVQVVVPGSNPIRATEIADTVKYND